MKNTVKLNREFLYAYRKGKKFVTDLFVFYYYKNSLKINKLGITVSTSIGKAAKRSRIKRLIRAAYSARCGDILKGYNIIIVARSKMLNSSFNDVLKEMDNCLRKSELL